MLSVLPLTFKPTQVAAGFVNTDFFFDKITQESRLRRELRYLRKISNK